jgi:hypothetical protein
MLDYKFNYDKNNKKVNYCNLNNIQIHYLTNNKKIINYNLNKNNINNNVTNNIICKGECLNVSCNKCFLKYIKDDNFLKDINIKNNFNKEFCKKKSDNIIIECKTKDFYKQKRHYANNIFFKSI